MADLNLKFENGKAPALNADNMNKIVNEINRTNAKTKDLQSEIATLVIEKGGSIVQANPEEVPTEKITSIRINEDVFEMASETGIEVTQAEYDAMEAAGEIEADVNYFVKDATTSSDSFAEEISNIKTSLNWKQLGGVRTGDEVVSLSDIWDEMHELEIFVEIESTNNTGFSIHINKERGFGVVMNGFYYDSAYNGTIAFIFDNSAKTIKPHNAWFRITYNGSVLTPKKWTIFWR